MVREPMKFKDGYLEIPDTPGLGIELDLKAIQKYPPKPWRRGPVVEPDGNIGYIREPRTQCGGKFPNLPVFLGKLGNLPPRSPFAIALRLERRLPC